jgi:hypothetical protein
LAVSQCRLTAQVAAQHPSCQVTALDLPAVLNVMRSSVQDAGRTERYRFLAADAFLDELGGA